MHWKDGVGKSRTAPTPLITRENISPEQLRQTIPSLPAAATARDDARSEAGPRASGGQHPPSPPPPPSFPAPAARPSSTGTDCGNAPDPTLQWQVVSDSSAKSEVKSEVGSDKFVWHDQRVCNVWRLNYHCGMWWPFMTGPWFYECCVDLRTNRDLGWNMAGPWWILTKYRITRLSTNTSRDTAVGQGSILSFPPPPPTRRRRKGCEGPLGGPDIE